MLVPYPIFSIPDSGVKKALDPGCYKIQSYFYFLTGKENFFLPIYKELKLFRPKKLSKLSKIWVWDPRSGIRKNLFRILFASRIKLWAVRVTLLFFFFDHLKTTFALVSHSLHAFELRHLFSYWWILPSPDCYLIKTELRNNNIRTFLFISSTIYQ
jgi:hypothetical protein